MKAAGTPAAANATMLGMPPHPHPRTSSPSGQVGEEEKGRRRRGAALHPELANNSKLSGRRTGLWVDPPVHRPE